MNPNAIYRPRKVFEDGVIIEGYVLLRVDYEHPYPQPDGVRIWWMKTIPEKGGDSYGFGMWRLDEVEEVKAK